MIFFFLGGDSESLDKRWRREGAFGHKDIGTNDERNTISNSAEFVLQCILCMLVVFVMKFVLLCILYNVFCIVVVWHLDNRPGDK